MGEGEKNARRTRRMSSHRFKKYGYVMFRRSIDEGRIIGWTDSLAKAEAWASDGNAYTTLERRGDEERMVSGVPEDPRTQLFLGKAG